MEGKTDTSSERSSDFWELLTKGAACSVFAGVAASVFDYFGRRAWTELGFHDRVPIVGMVVALGILTILIFGQNQFKLIASELGGGRPEIAYIKFNDANLHLADRLKVPLSSTNPVVDGFRGPIAVLLKTESELIFINFDDYIAATFMTNNVPANLGATNLTSSNTPSTTPTPSQVVPHPSRNKGKQVRADLIEAIVYTSGKLE